MYVCMYVKSLSFEELPMESGNPNGPRGGAPSKKWVQCPNPAGTIGLVSSTLAHTYALSAFSVANFNLGS